MSKLVLDILQKKVVKSKKIQKNFEFFDLYCFGFPVFPGIFKSKIILSGDTPSNTWWEAEVRCCSIFKSRINFMKYIYIFRCAPGRQQPLRTLKKDEFITTNAALDHWHWSGSCSTRDQQNPRWTWTPYVIWIHHVLDGNYTTPRAHTEILCQLSELAGWLGKGQYKSYSIYRA